MKEKNNSKIKNIDADYMSTQAKSTKSYNKKDKKKKSKIRMFFSRLLFLVLILLIIVVSIFIYNINKNGGGLEGFTATLVGTNQETIKSLPPIYVVLLGQSQNLTDTIMLVKYNPKEQTASMLSIPRDTFIGSSKATASPSDKINALCQGTNPEKTVKAVSELTGIPVTNYVLVDTKGLRELVDLIGGVWFDVPIDMKYTDKKQNLYIDLKAGYQLLDGDKAEQVVRFRHNSDGTTYSAEYGEQDFGRARTQREFLKATAKQILKPQNVFKIGELLDLAYNNIKTNMTMTEFKDYIPALVNFNPDDLQSDRLPGEPQYLNGYSFVVNDEDESEKIINELFSEQLEINSNKNEDTTPIGEGIKVEILNGTGNSNTLKNLEEKLVENSYTIVNTGDTSKVSKTVIINNTDKDEKISNDLKTVVGIGEQKLASNESSDADFTIIIGTDY